MQPQRSGHDADFGRVSSGVATSVSRRYSERRCSVMRLTVVGTRRHCGPPQMLSRSTPMVYPSTKSLPRSKRSPAQKGMERATLSGRRERNDLRQPPSDLLTGTLHGRPRAILRAIALALLRHLLSLRLVGVENGAF